MMNEDLDRLFESAFTEQPNPRLLAETAQTRLKPVRPLPSRLAVISLALLCFVLVSLIAAWPLGYAGFLQLSTVPRTLYSIPLLALAALLAFALDQELVPGSKHRFSARAVLLVTLAALSGLTVALFPNFAADHFLRRGIPCLCIGTICAGFFSALLTIWLRRGFATSLRSTGALAGTFAGLFGFAVLALHCPVQTASHILLWHFGAVLVAGACGVLIGIWYRRS